MKVKIIVSTPRFWKKYYEESKHTSFKKFPPEESLTYKINFFACLKDQNMHCMVRYEKGLTKRSQKTLERSSHPSKKSCSKRSYLIKERDLTEHY